VRGKAKHQDHHEHIKEPEDEDSTQKITTSANAAQDFVPSGKENTKATPSDLGDRASPQIVKLSNDERVLNEEGTGEDNDTDGR